MKGTTKKNFGAWFGCLEEGKKLFLAKTFKKYPTWKRKLVNLQNRYIGHQGGI